MQVKPVESILVVSALMVEVVGIDLRTEYLKELVLSVIAREKCMETGVEDLHVLSGPVLYGRPV